jgi:Sulfotransferase family
MKMLMERYWMVRGGRKDRLLEPLYLTLPKEKRMERGRQQFYSYFKFGFVRNPWGRVASLYERKEALELRHQMNFDQFVDWIQYSSATCVHSSPHRYQLDWFVDPNGKVLADFIGRFESLEEDWKIVAKKLGVSENLPHRRPNPRTRHYAEYYNDRTRAIIGEKFKVDIEYFNYRFE